MGTKIQIKNDSIRDFGMFFFFSCLFRKNGIVLFRVYKPVYYLLWDAIIVQRSLSPVTMPPSVLSRHFETIPKCFLHEFLKIETT